MKSSPPEQNNNPIEIKYVFDEMIDEVDQYLLNNHNKFEDFTISVLQTNYNLKVDHFKQNHQCMCFFIESCLYKRPTPIDHNTVLKPSDFSYMDGGCVQVFEENDSGLIMYKQSISEITFSIENNKNFNLLISLIENIENLKHIKESITIDLK